MARYTLPSPVVIQDYDGVDVRTVRFDKDRDAVVIELSLFKGPNLIRATQVDGPAGAFLSFLVTNFDILAGADFFDKVLSALAHPTVGRLPSGGTLV